jgi:protein SCO1/2
MNKYVISTVAKRRRKSPRAFWLACFLVLASIAAHSQAMTKGILSPPANVRPPGLKNVGIQQNLNQQIPPDLIFRDETGKTVRLGDYFTDKPIILNLVYYRCPMLCGEVLSGLTSALKVLKFNVGDEFEVLTVSFDPKDTPEIGAAKKAEYMERYKRPNAAKGWHFLTGSAASIDALTRAAGFQYQYDKKTEQFAHSTAIMILTPQGKIAQYYYGVEFAPKDLRMGLIQASQNKIGTIVDQVFLYCYHYDPMTGRYGAVISRILQVSALATVLIMGIFMMLLFRHGSDADHRGAGRVINHV